MKRAFQVIVECDSYSNMIVLANAIADGTNRLLHSGDGADIHMTLEEIRTAGWTAWKKE